MTEFWLISAPGEKTCQQTWDKMMVATTRTNNLSTNNKFNIPDLKVGTLDVLVGLSDELAKLDSFVESVVKKVAQYMADVLEDSRDKVQENLLANGGEQASPSSFFISTPSLLAFFFVVVEVFLFLIFYLLLLLVDLITYITRFQWDMAKYPIKQSLKNISEIISKQVTQIDNDLKARASAYNNLKGNLQNLERKNAGSLLTRSLADIVKKEDFVLDSEYLVTLLVVVPKTNYGDWQKTYETLAEMVVPRSTNLLFEDQDSGLFSVTLFRKAIDDFRHKARENKFVVRDFQYNEEEMKADKEEMTRLSTDKKKQFGPLVRWLKVNFSEAFIAWIHIKALRVFVESVLRYGLPVNFQAMLLQPNKKNMKKLREVLYELYKHLDSSAAAIIDQSAMDIPGLNLSQQEYYPYVYYKIDCNLLDFK
ncbi:V-type proton ATPase subunit C 1-A isoform X1 [Hemibagrus wyckioides]|uniref:V-type proton ATPase subunit C 1-A isoform X1 n=1 Tax=Hemibagrus wyckioides TaxID=337641 RepID=UPI00266CFF78|nr:V-type proton ATPase subunit C 1-A isoform X1 [Hemibagrus wyckioides]